MMSPSAGSSRDAAPARRLEEAGALTPPQA